MARLDVMETFSGISFPGHLHSQESLQFAQSFDFRDGDIVTVCYPKSGTTWMQEILTMIYSKGDSKVAKTIPNWERTPWLEHIYIKGFLKEDVQPRFITTHLNYETLGPALKKSKAKVIYVARNPKDVVVSYYHFHKIAKFLPDPGTFAEFLNNFLEGTLNYGSWFNHVKGWLSHREELNLLCMNYEDMKKDLHGSIEKVCEYLGFSVNSEELQNIENHCHFTSMSQNSMVNYTLVPPEIIDHSQGKFMRKGTTGDWKEHFTSEQSAHFDEIYKKEMQDLDFCLELDPGTNKNSSDCSLLLKGCNITAD